MTPREFVLEQLRHRATFPVPFNLDFEGDVTERLDVYYGGPGWRERLTPYIRIIEGVDTIQEKPISETHTRDVFGGIWRHDRRPLHLEVPALKSPSFNGYNFPSFDIFWDEKKKESLQRELGNHPDSFRIVVIPWGLFEQSWRIRGFENALIDAIVEPDFYQELLNKLTKLYLKFVNACAELN